MSDKSRSHYSVFASYLKLHYFKMWCVSILHECVCMMQNCKRTIRPCTRCYFLEAWASYSSWFPNWCITQHYFAQFEHIDAIFNLSLIANSNPFSLGVQLGKDRIWWEIRAWAWEVTLIGFCGPTPWMAAHISKEIMQLSFIEKKTFLFSLGNLNY